MDRADFLKKVIVGIAAAKGLSLTNREAESIANDCELVGGAGALGHKAVMPDFCLKIPFEGEHYLIPIYHSAPSGIVR